MDTLIAFLALQPLLALFLVIASGYALGAVNIKGFSLGVGAVLFSGPFIGAVAPKAQPPALVGTLGLVTFLYGLGGRRASAAVLRGPGRQGGPPRDNLLAGLGLAAAAAVTVADSVGHGRVTTRSWRGSSPGAGTNAATLQAALEAAGNGDPGRRVPRWRFPSASWAPSSACTSCNWC